MMLLRYYLVAFLVAGLFLLGFLSAVGQMEYDYNITVDDTYSGSYDKIEEITGLTNTMDESLRTGESTEDEPLDTKIKDSYNAISYTRDTYTTVKNVTTAVSDDFELPPMFSKVAWQSIIIIISFIIISAFMRNKV